MTPGFFCWHLNVRIGHSLEQTGTHEQLSALRSVVNMSVVFVCLIVCLFGGSFACLFCFVLF